APRNVRDQPLENLASVFILVEAAVQEFAEKASALRDAESVCPLESRFAFAGEGIVFSGSVLEGGNQIAHAGEADSVDERITGLVNQFIELPLLQTRREFQLDGRQVAVVSVLDFTDV